MKQQDLNVLILLPVGLALLAGWIGWGSPWRRVIFNLAFTFATIVFAFQHNVFLTNLVIERSSPRNLTYTQISAAVFGASVVIGYVALYIVYQAMWRPDFAQLPSQSSGWSKLLRGVLNAAAGWALGVVLLVCVLGFSLPTENVLSVVPSGSYRDLLAGTSASIADVGDAWTPGQLPVVFRR